MRDMTVCAGVFIDMPSDVSVFNRMAVTQFREGDSGREEPRACDRLPVSQDQLLWRGVRLRSNGCST